MRPIQRTLKAVVITLAVGSTVPFGIRSQMEGLRLAATLRGTPMSERKEVLFAPWYAQVIEIRDALPPDAQVDFVMARPSARDIAILGGAVLQPRDVRYFDGWDAWRARRRAEFLHDRRAANAAPGPLPAPAVVVVIVDPDVSPQFRLIARTLP